jgi:hypothetical protein
VGGTHLCNEPIVTGSLADGGFTVFVDQDTLTDTMDIAMNTAYLIYVGNAPTFRGALLRFASTSGTDGAFTLEPDDSGTAAAAACNTVGDGVLGLTHVDSEPKFAMTGVLKANTVGSIALDITVVISNNNVNGSSYYYSPYTLNVIDSAEEPDIDTNNTTETTTSAPAVAAEPAPTALAAPAESPTVAASAPQDLVPKSPSATPKPPSSSLANKAPTTTTSCAVFLAITLGWIMYQPWQSSNTICTRAKATPM